MGATERFLVGVRVWCRQGSFNWKWASALMAVVLVCGTALFIYADIKAQSAERTKREAESEKARDYQRNYYLAEQAAAMRRANEIAQEAQEKAQEEARRKELEENSKSFGSLLRPSLAQQQLNEMRRANDMAESERILPSDSYEKFRQQQALKGQQQALEDMNTELRRIREAKEREEFDRRFRVR
jgi:predicted  nucleic acid-binding Zn-ribbon protein